MTSVIFYLGGWNLKMFMEDYEFDGILDQITCMKRFEYEEMINALQ